MTRPASRRRGIRLASTVLLGVALAALPVVPAAACACGGVASSPGSEVAVNEERR